VRSLALFGPLLSPPDAARPGLNTFSSPVLFHYTADRAVLATMAERTFEALRQGTIRLDIRHRYPLASAAQAHRDLESRTTIGPLVLVP
jgi:NADPH2:quinone reductase